MAQAAARMGLHFNTFKKKAMKLGCYKPNQGAGGVKRNATSKIPLNKILNGEYPEFQTFKLKNRLIKEGVFENKCSVCDLKQWKNKPLNMELDHIDGDRTNHKLKNLRMICPNCHAQTDTYRAKNI
jgi:hypothetical protein